MTRADFSDFVRAVSMKLYVQAYNILKDRQGAEDAVQEVFLRIWKMHDRLKEYKSIEALASVITKNYCIDQLRQMYNRETTGDSSSLLTYNDVSPSPYEILERSETASIMEKLIDEMPEIYRNMIRLRDIEGLSYEEIASKTNQTVNNLRVNLSRARKMLRNGFEKYHNGKA